MPGNGVRPMAAPKAVYGMNVVRAIPAALARMTGHRCPAFDEGYVRCPDHLHDERLAPHGFDEPACLKERDEQDLPFDSKGMGKARPRQPDR